MEQWVSMVTLGVADVPRARIFYEHGLGWTPIKLACDELAVFRTGPLLLSLCTRSALAAESGQDDTTPMGSFGGMTLTYAARSREHVLLILARAEASGAHVTRRAIETHWGGYAGCLSTAVGNWASGAV